MAEDKLKSAVWEHFVRITDNGIKFSRCAKCGTHIKGHVAFNNKRHLRTQHEISGPDTLDAQRRQAQRPDLQHRELERLYEKKRQLETEVLHKFGRLPANITGLSPPPSRDPRPQTVRLKSANEEQRLARRTQQNRTNVGRYRERDAHNDAQLVQLQAKVNLLENMLATGAPNDAPTRILNARDDPPATHISMPPTYAADPFAEAQLCLKCRRCRENSFPICHGELLAIGRMGIERLGLYMSVHGAVIKRYVDEFAESVPLTTKWDKTIFYMNDNESAFFQQVAYSVPLWNVAANLRTALQSDPENPLLLRLYDAICIVIACRLVHLVGRINEEILEIVAADSQLIVSDSLRNWRDLSHSLERAAIEPPDAIDDAVILDVIRSAGFAAGVSRQFYVKLANMFPRIGHMLRLNFSSLPRECGGTCMLLPKSEREGDDSPSLQMERAWNFNDPTAHTLGDAAKFTLRQSIEVIENYQLHTLTITMGDNASQQFHFLDLMNEELNRNVALLVAKEVVLCGFNRLQCIAQEEIDKIKLLIRPARSVGKLRFRLTQMHHFEALVRNDKHFPAGLQSLDVYLCPDDNGHNSVDGDALAANVSRIRTCLPIGRIPRLNVRIERVAHAAAILTSLFEVFLSDECPDTMKYSMDNLDGHSLEASVFAAMNGFTVESEHPIRNVYMRCQNENFFYVSSTEARLDVVVKNYKFDKLKE